MLPAEQSFVSGHRFAGDIDQRLNEQAQFTAPYGMAQIARQSVAFVQLGVHFRFEHFPLAAPGLLDCIQCNVGIRSKLSPVIGVERGQGDTDRYAGVQLMPLDHDRFGQRDQQQFSKPDRVIAGIDTTYSDGEFIAAQSSNLRLLPAEAALADQIDQLLADMTQECIANRMAMHIVDRLEVVEIKQHQGNLFAASAGRHQLIQLSIKQGAVRQPGQRVEMGHPVGAVFGLPADCDVRDDAAIGRLAAAARGPATHSPPPRFAIANAVERKHYLADGAPVGNRSNKFVVGSAGCEQGGKGPSFKRLRSFSGGGSQPL